jgi:hypothetical protein
MTVAERKQEKRRCPLDNEELVGELNGLFTDAMRVETDVDLMKTLRGKSRREKDDNGSGKRRIRPRP